MEDRAPITFPPMKLNVHEHSFSTEDILLSEAHFPDLRTGDLVHVFLAGSDIKFSLRIKWFTEVTDRSVGRVQVRACLSSSSPTSGLWRDRHYSYMQHLVFIFSVARFLCDRTS